MMKKEISITIKNVTEPQEIDTNCAFIVVKKGEGVESMLFSKTATNFDVYDVIKGALLALKDIYQKYPELQIIENIRNPKRIEGDPEEEITFSRDETIIPNLPDSIITDWD